MTVKELIHKLKYYDPNAEVVYKLNMDSIEQGNSINETFGTENSQGKKYVILLTIPIIEGGGI